MNPVGLLAGGWFQIITKSAPAVLQILAHSFGRMLSSVGGARKVFEYLDRTPRVGTDGTLRPDVMNGHVTFDRVHFAYPSCPENHVLQVSANLQPGRGAFGQSR